MFTKRHWNTLDITLILAVCILTVMGIIAIGSALHINLSGDNIFEMMSGDNAKEMNKQIIFFIIGLFIMAAAIIVDYNFIGNLYIFIYVVSMLLLILVLVLPSSANAANNVSRWIQIGGFSLQPSEFAKVMLIISLSKLIDKNKDKINKFFVLILVVAFGMFPFLLIQMQPSLSASLVIVAILLIELFIAKISYKYILTVAGVGIGIVSLIFLDVTRETPILIDKILNSYQIGRILSFIDPMQYVQESFQTRYSISAIGSGQLYGKGLFKGMLNQLNYLPEPQNDFIFSVIAEEFGFVGCMVILAFIFFIVLRCIIIAAKAEDFYGTLIASGVGGMIAFQTFVHVGVTTGFLPNTGMPLPFISSGGSSLWTNMIAIGLVLNIGTKRVKTLF